MLLSNGAMRRPTAGNKLLATDYSLCGPPSAVGGYFPLILAASIIGRTGGRVNHLQKIISLVRLLNFCPSWGLTRPCFYAMISSNFSEFFEEKSVSKRLRQLIEQQAQIKVAQRTQDADLSAVWFGTLAVFTAGVFYFWAYYFWGDWWRVLTGG